VSGQTPKNGQIPKSAQIPKKEYERELLELQGELATMTEWIRQSRARVVVLFEGRDAAGKGGVIKRISQYLSPRTCRIVALPTPTDRERGEWYFQRYVRQLPTAGEMTLFDRSWYNRAGVERVMGFCTDEEYQRFLRQCPAFEHQLLEDGIILVKYWFSVSDEEQERRFQSRVDDPLRRWKLSPMDLEARQRWVEYSKAKDHMFLHTDTPESPWFVVEADDKRRARLNCIAHLLSRVPYQPVDESRLKLAKRAKGEHYERPPRGLSTYVPDHAGSLHQ
jgi:polyphosphate kinase